MTDEESRHLAVAVLTKFAKKRQSLGLSKRKLAEMANLDPRAISLLENAERMPAITTVLRLASALEIEFCEIFADLKPPLKRQ